MRRNNAPALNAICEWANVGWNIYQLHDIYGRQSDESLAAAWNADTQ